MGGKCKLTFPHPAGECVCNRACQTNLERAGFLCEPRSPQRIALHLSAASSPKRSCAGKAPSVSSLAPIVSVSLQY